MSLEVWWDINGRTRFEYLIFQKRKHHQTIFITLNEYGTMVLKVPDTKESDVKVTRYRFHSSTFQSRKLNARLVGDVSTFCEVSGKRPLGVFLKNMLFERCFFSACVKSIGKMVVIGESVRSMIVARVGIDIVPVSTRGH